MSSVDFPDSASNGETFSSNGIIYVYQDGSWIRKAPTVEPLLTALLSAKGSIISASAPSAPTELLIGTTNGHGLKANPSTTTGLEWAPMPSETASSLDSIGDVSASSPVVNRPLTWSGSAWAPNSSLYFGDLTITTKTGAYTIAASDLDTLIMVDSVSSVAITVPPGSSVPIAVGRYLHIMQIGTGQVSVSPGAGVTINGRTKLRTQFSMATLLERASDSWVFMGDTVD
jgi:hypothetical protein